MKWETETPETGDLQHGAHLRSWFEAETAGHLDAADRACRRTFDELPLVAVPAGFAARVLARVLAGQAAQVRGDWFARPLVRLAIAASLLVTASLAVWLPGRLVAARGELRPGGLIAGLEWLVTAAAALANGLVGVWHLLFAAAADAARATTSPAFLPLLVVVVLVSLGLTRLVSDLASSQGGARHGDGF